VLSDPAQPGELRDLPFHERSGIDESAEFCGRMTRLEFVAKRVQALLHDLVVIAASRVAGDFSGWWILLD